jgi:hypothetical protein
MPGSPSIPRSHDEIPPENLSASDVVAVIERAPREKLEDRLNRSMRDTTARRSAKRNIL